MIKQKIPAAKTTGIDEEKMTGFIEVTEKYSDEKVTIAVSHIEYVKDINGQAFISTASLSLKKHTVGSGVYTKESYSEILLKIGKAIK